MLKTSIVLLMSARGDHVRECPSFCRFRILNLKPFVSQQTVSHTDFKLTF
jgi:hypothetical protein